MKTAFITASLFLAIGFVQVARAQSTTGGRSGGSTASTGAGYESSGKRPAETSASSMTIADEGASRAYMYVPPVAGGKTKNRSASPDGSGTTPPASPSTRSRASSGKSSGTVRGAAHPQN